MCLIFYLEKKMKKCLYFFFLLSLAFTLISCASTMTFDKKANLVIPDEFQAKSSPDLEFIGFKADANNLPTGNGETIKFTGWTRETYYFPSDFDLWKTYKTDTYIKNLGNVLEKSNVAYDKSFSYFGIYSLQELELYKSDKRFITFVEVNKNHLSGTIKDNWVWPAAILMGTGAGIAPGGLVWVVSDPDGTLGLKESGKKMVGIGIGTLALGAVFCALPAKSTLMFNGEYQIYVYDTKEKKVIYKDAVIVSEMDTYKGSFFNENTNQNEVYNYYGSLIYNAILQKYVEVERFLYNYIKE